ncbi:uncharacterized protein LOC122566650 [Bombus pyrosoma]|uniref:uncharacterized protein LOC122566650 n=1 Tax=Bombus pyrosoma TaxID=396416 RepID=UPI001CB9CD45|nr:uncharacterized protein LOC122566650 [Bombus pyrosoma]
MDYPLDRCSERAVSKLANHQPVHATQHLIQSQPSLQYQSTNSHIVQQSSTGTYAQQFPYIDDRSQVQLQERLILYRITSNYNGGFQSLDDAADEVKEAGNTSILNMDNRHNFDLSLDQLDSAELADFETALSEHLSSGLSISDFITLETNKETNAGPSNTEQNNTADNFTSIINNAIQELCTLDNMYESMSETNGVINAGPSDIENDCI